MRAAEFELTTASMTAPALDADYVEALNNAGRLLRGMKQLQEALEHLSRAVRHDLDIRMPATTSA